ncbi:MAG: hypothetical protein ACPG5B_15735 [Chitinophagales bacterium]
MTIQHSDTEIIIRLPKNVDIQGLQRLINFLTYKELSTNSKATQKQINELSKSINQDWWAKHKNKFLK